MQKTILTSENLKQLIVRLEAKMKPTSDFVTPAEMAEAFEIILRQEKSEGQKQEINTLNLEPQVFCNSKVLNFYPFLQNKILCSGGNCFNKELPVEAKYRQKFLKTANEPSWKNFRCILLLYAAVCCKILQKDVIFGLQLPSINSGRSY